MPLSKPVSFSSSPPTSAAPVAEIQRSALLLADGKSAEAVRRLEALSAAVPAYATSQVLLAKAYEAEQRWEDALEAWHRAHFLAPGSPLIQRERRRLLEAKARATEAELLPGVPSEAPVDRSSEEVDGEIAEEPGEQDEVVENAMVEPVEVQAETMPDEALLDEAQPDEDPHKVAEPSDSEEQPETLAEELPEAIPGVFVDDSTPVSDALGAETAEPMAAEPIVRVPDGEAGWRKPSGEIRGEADAESADTGWAVVSETETERTERVVIEAQIAAPIDEPSLDVRTETEYIKDAPVVGADAAVADDLDSLIRELEDAPRIRPDPDFVG
ncbi:MAG: hypothetical protein IIB09_08575, partial [Bacteroidetes bacterium]|nr:hypothetical protein [Bacteroidota bacterium]